MKKTVQGVFILVASAMFSFSASNTRGLGMDIHHTVPVSNIAISGFLQGDLQGTGDDINDVVFYPNPVKNFLTVRFPRKGNFTVIIYNIIGDKVMTKSVMDDNEIHLDVSDLQNGLYFISYEFDDKVLTKRFSKVL